MREGCRQKKEDKIVRISAIKISDWLGTILSMVVIALIFGR
jgi:nicotinamide riboside transporter PnuC